MAFIPAAQTSLTPPTNPGPSSWGAWGQVRGVNSVAGTPAAVTGGPNLIDVFVLGDQGNLIHAYMVWQQKVVQFADETEYYVPDWGNAQLGPPPGVTLTSPVCPVSPNSYNLDVFGVDTQGMVHHIHWSPNAWSAWEALPGPGTPIQPLTLTFYWLRELQTTAFFATLLALPRRDAEVLALWPALLGLKTLR